MKYNRLLIATVSAYLALAGCSKTEEQVKNIKPKDYYLVLYKRLLLTVFLRSSSDFSYKLSNPKLQWGALALLSPLLKKLPYYVQRSIELSLGRKEYFYQFVDARSHGLRFYGIIAKILLIFIIFMNICLLIYFKNRKSPSKKD